MTAPLCEYCKQPTTDCGPDGYGGTDWWCKNPECEKLLGFARRIAQKPLSAAQGVWPDFIAPPKHDNPDPRWQDPSLPDFRQIWKVARECGYSVGLHGYMKRDCDMIAAPWTDKAVIAFELIDRLCSALNAKVVGPVAGKPHGRLGWNLQVDGYVKVIDISVMPRSQDVSAAALSRDAEHVNETAETEHDAGNVLTDAALRGEGGNG